MIFNDTIYHICKRNYNSDISPFKIEVTRVYHLTINNRAQIFFNSKNLMSVFSEDVKGFLDSLHPIVSSRMIEGYLDKKNDKESFENEIRSMSTFEKYLRKLKYKKNPKVQSLSN